MSTAGSLTSPLGALVELDDELINLPWVVVVLVIVLVVVVVGGG